MAIVVFQKPLTLVPAAFALLLGPLVQSNSFSTDLRSPPRREWPTVGGNLYNHRYSELSQINRGNVGRLGAIWVSDSFNDGSTSYVTPVVTNNVMYITAGAWIYALNATTGTIMWSYKTVTNRKASEHLPSADNATAHERSPSAPPNPRGIAIGHGLIFVGLTDGHVIALRARTGELAWIQQTGSEEPKRFQMASPAPTYVNGVVLTGLSNGDANLRGRVTALEANTGKIIWQWFSIPGPDEAGHETWPSFNDTWKFGGGGVWTNAAVDPGLGLAYFATGNPVPAFAGDWRPGDNLYTCSVVAIDIATGKLKWHYQLTHHDVFESDAGTPVILYDSQSDGRVQNGLAVLRADGYLFQLDRRTGIPMLPVEERQVPRHDRQRTSPTQPFPVVGESILMGCDEWKKEKIPLGFVLGCMWTPPAFPPPSADAQNVLAPFPSVRVSPMAYSPQTEYFYAQATSFLSWPRRSEDPYHLTFDTTVFNLNAYGGLAAIDSRTGKIAWKRPIYTNGRLPIYLRGGPLATAGGLIFRGSGDGNVEAYDAKNGDVLWQFQTGAINGGGSPASYSIKGEQYVAIPMGSAVWTFKLGGSLPAAAPPLLPKQEGGFSGPIIDTGEIETTSLKSHVFGSGTRYFIDEFAFNPSRARVPTGTKVMFVNNGIMQHEIAALDGSWSTGPLSPTQEAWVLFNKPGEYSYVCKNHPWTHGQLLVVSDTSQSTPEAGDSAGAHHEDNSFADQAARGKQEFIKNCSACHGKELRGQAMAPALTGDAFALRWRSTTMGALFDRIRLTMPQAAPGSLDRETYLSIVAYVLHTNGMAPTRSGLEGRPEELGITLEKLGGPQ